MLLFKYEPAETNQNFSVTARYLCQQGCICCLVLDVYINGFQLLIYQWWPENCWDGAAGAQYQAFLSAVQLLSKHRAFKDSSALLPQPGQLCVPSVTQLCTVSAQEHQRQGTSVSSKMLIHALQGAAMVPKGSAELGFSNLHSGFAKGGFLWTLHGKNVQLSHALSHALGY